MEGLKYLNNRCWGIDGKWGFSLKMVKVLEGDRGHGPIRGGGVGRNGKGVGR